VNQSLTNEQTIIKYLLNELSEEDETRFEEAYLKDARLFELVQAMEEELTEDYVQGHISGRERQSFERHYLASDQRRAKIEAARQLTQVCRLKLHAQAGSDDRLAPKFSSLRSQLQLLAKQLLTPGFGVAAAVSLLLGLVLIIGWLWSRRLLIAINEQPAAIEQRAEKSEPRKSEQSIDLTEKTENPGPPPTRLKQEQAKSQASRNQIYSLVLTPGIRTIGSPGRAVISTHTKFVDLRVNLERQEATNLSSCRVTVRTVEGGREIWKQEGIKLQQSRSVPYVVVRVPANNFKAVGGQDFTLTLGAKTAEGLGYEELGSYYFQVIGN